MTSPEGLLGTIARAKRAEVAARFDGVDIDSLRAHASRTALSLEQAIAAPGARFIMEIKKASPSAGAIRAEADAGAIARGYAGVADAISVLTDGRFFSGSLADIVAARRAFAGPILAKDFFLDPRQVVEARIAGADAILIMLSLVDDAGARELMAEAVRLGMDALVEVHDETEMARARALGANLIGINNRDFRDLSIDLATTERLAALAGSRTLVSESGILGKPDVERLSGQVDGFLVGSALMRAADPALAARALAFGRVKLCGLARAEDIDSARAASFAGLVLVESSPRYVTPAIAHRLAHQSRGAGLLPVGIFRNAPIDQIVTLAVDGALHAVQLHGAEDEDFIRRLRRQLPAQCEIWAAVDAARAFAGRAGDRLLFDNGAGGSGMAFDWAAVERHLRLPEGIVAGGIGPGNARAAAALGAYAIDVGSAVDARPGRKSPQRIAALFEALRPDSRRALRRCA